MPGDLNYFTNHGIIPALQSHDLEALDRLERSPELDTWLAPEKFKNMSGAVEPVCPFAVKIGNRTTA